MSAFIPISLATTGKKEAIYCINLKAHFPLSHGLSYRGIIPRSNSLSASCSFTSDHGTEIIFILSTEILYSMSAPTRYRVTGAT
jgi:hypothetical protein